MGVLRGQLKHHLIRRGLGRAQELLIVPELAEPLLVGNRCRYAKLTAFGDKIRELLCREMLKLVNKDAELVAGSLPVTDRVQEFTHKDRADKLFDICRQICGKLHKEYF